MSKLKLWEIARHLENGGRVQSRIVLLNPDPEYSEWEEAIYVKVEGPDAPISDRMWIEYRIDPDDLTTGGEL